MNKQLIAYEYKRNNSRAHKQSYIDYVSFLIPEIWEIPDVRLSLSIRVLLARREVIFLNRDIRDAQYKIQRLKQRLEYLQKYSHQDMLNKEEKAVLPRVATAIRRQGDWVQDLNEFKGKLNSFLLHLDQNI